MALPFSFCLKLHLNIILKKHFLFTIMSPQITHRKSFSLILLRSPVFIFTTNSIAGLPKTSWLNSQTSPASKNWIKLKKKKKPINPLDIIKFRVWHRNPSTEFLKKKKKSSIHNPAVKQSFGKERQSRHLIVRKRIHEEKLKPMMEKWVISWNECWKVIFLRC